MTYIAYLQLSALRQTRGRHKIHGSEIKVWKTWAQPPFKNVNSHTSYSYLKNQFLFQSKHVASLL